jgi:hypothetical protein
VTSVEALMDQDELYEIRHMVLTRLDELRL